MGILVSGRSILFHPISVVETEWHRFSFSITRMKGCCLSCGWCGGFFTCQLAKALVLGDAAYVTAAALCDSGGIFVHFAIAAAPLSWGVSVFAAMTGAESKTIFALVFYRMKQL